MRGRKRGVTVAMFDQPTDDWVKITDSADYDTRGCLALALAVMQGMKTEDACSFAGTKATMAASTSVYCEP